MATENQAQNDPRALWKTIRLFMVALVSMSLLIVLTAIIVQEIMGPIQPGYNAYKKWLLPALGIVSFVFLLFSRSEYQKSINKARSSGEDLVAKLTHFREALIKRIFLMEMIVVFGAFLYCSTGDFSYLAFSAVMVGFMISSLPRKSRVAQLLNLDSTQIAQLND